MGVTIRNKETILMILQYTVGCRHSNSSPHRAIGVSKWFLSRALIICSKKYLDNEIEFLINDFVENGHNTEVLEKAAKNI